MSSCFRYQRHLFCFMNQLDSRIDLVYLDSIIQLPLNSSCLLLVPTVCYHYRWVLSSLSGDLFWGCSVSSYRTMLRHRNRGYVCFALKYGVPNFKWICKHLTTIWYSIRRTGALSDFGIRSIWLLVFLWFKALCIMRNAFVVSSI